MNLQAIAAGSRSYKYLEVPCQLDL